jgi:outer membrane protein insertion porin family
MFLVRFIFYVCVCGGVLAPSLVAEKIKLLNIEGLRRLDKELVRSYLPFKVGQEFSEPELNEALQKLFALGLFSDLKTHFKNGRLTIHVTENKTINQIAFEGNHKIDDAMLRKTISLKPSQVYTLEKIQTAVNVIQTLYRFKGYFSPTITPKIIPLKGGRVNLIFEIVENKPVKIARISFVGNKAFSGGALRSEISTRESRWWRFFSSDDVYDPTKLDFDKELLYRYYYTHGYLDFQVTQTSAELTPDKERFYITFHVTEGQPYTIADVNILSTLRAVSLKELEASLSLKKGQVADMKKVELQQDNLEKLLSERGVFVDIERQVEKHKNNTVTITFKITRRKPVNIRYIRIHGNALTHDDVIRREMKIVEGDPLSAYNVSTSKQAITNLDFFNNVGIELEDTPTPQEKDLIVSVEEKSTGELMFSGGYSTTEGFFVEGKASERNFRGKGQQVDLAARLAKSSRSIFLGFLEPRLWGLELEGGADVFYQEVRQRTQGQEQIAFTNIKGGFTERNFGLTLKMGYGLGERLFERWRYSIMKQKFLNYSQSVFYNALTDDVLSILGHDLTYDKRDSMVEPREGYYGLWSIDFSGLGGTVDFLKNQLVAGYYVPFTDSKEVFLKIRSSYGLLSRAGKQLRVVDNFFKGGVDLRGFEDSGIGPRDVTTGDALGGRQFFITNFELYFPLSSREFGLKSFVFSDWGSLWSSGLKKHAFANRIKGDEFYLRGSVGIGVRWRSPFGAIGCSFAHALRYLKGVDQKQCFRLDFGTDF